jgi:hypothetical protein
MATGPPSLLFTDGIPPTTRLILVPVCDVVLVNRAWWCAQTPAQRGRELRALLLGEMHEVGAPCYVRVRNPRALNDWDDDWEQVARAAAVLPNDWWDAVAHLPG